LRASPNWEGQVHPRDCFGWFRRARQRHRGDVIPRLDLSGRVNPIG